MQARDLQADLLRSRLNVRRLVINGKTHLCGCCHEPVELLETRERASAGEAGIDERVHRVRCPRWSCGKETEVYELTRAYERVW